MSFSPRIRQNGYFFNLGTNRGITFGHDQDNNISINVYNLYSLLSEPHCWGLQMSALCTRRHHARLLASTILDTHWLPSGSRSECWEYPRPSWNQRLLQGHAEHCPQAWMQPWSNVGPVSPWYQRLSDTLAPTRLWQLSPLYTPDQRISRPPQDEGADITNVIDVSGIECNIHNFVTAYKYTWPDALYYRQHFIQIGFGLWCMMYQYIMVHKDLTVFIICLNYKNGIKSPIPVTLVVNRRNIFDHSGWVQNRPRTKENISNQCIPITNQFISPIHRGIKFPLFFFVLLSQ